MIAIVLLNYIYSALIIGGGIFGFIKSQSAISVVFSLITGILTIYATSKFENRKEKNFGYRLACVVTFILTCTMGYRWLYGAKFMPAGMVTILSASMTFLNMIHWNFA